MIATNFIPALLALWVVAFVLWRGSIAPIRHTRRDGPLRVALFSGNYNCVADGANQALNKLVAHLERSAGAQVRVYSPVTPVAAFAPAGTLVAVPSVGIPGRPEYRLALGLPARQRDDLARFDPDIVHLSAPDLLGEAARRYARPRGIPVVASLHTRFETYLDYYRLAGLKPAVEARLRRFYDGSDYVLAPTVAIADELRAQRPGSHIRIWGRGVDRDRFSPRRRDTAWRSAHGYGPDDAVVLFFGRLVREKGLDVFADAIERLRARGCPVRPLVVGDGPARDWFAARLANVVFTGHLSGDALGQAVASADILVNPSITEAFGNVTLEGMAAGLAVVCADVASGRSLLDHGRTGLLVSPGDAGACATAVAGLIADPVCRRALGAAAAAESARHEWPEVLDGVVTVYGEALRRAAAPVPPQPALVGAPAT